MRAQLLETLMQLSAAFFQNIERKALVQAILDAAIALTDGDRGSVFLAPQGQPEGSPAKLKSMIATGMGDQEIEVDADRGVVGSAFTECTPVIINDAQNDSRFFGKIDEETQYVTESILCVPLQSPRGPTMGVIEILNSKRGRFTEEQMHILQILALFAAVALETRETVQNLRSAKENLAQARRSRIGDLGKFVLQSSHPALQDFYDKIPRLAKSDSSILIEGESGTGKEVIAQVVHMHSERRDSPFIAINCAAIPESLFEAELFGVAKGAATGTSARKGKIELADGGTLFLDEVGELPLSVQAKLLRVLQERQVQRVGSEEKPKKVNFRVLAATNRDLAEMVKAGAFREDLFYRVNVFRMRLPPLRERKGDLIDLCHSILRNFAQTRGWKKKTLSPSAVQDILSYPWPGNIRQLQNKLEGACIVSGDRTTMESRDLQLDTVSVEEIQVSTMEEPSSTNIAQLPAAPELPPTFKGFNLKDAKDAVEWLLIQKALERTGGNKTRAAKLLGITREGLRRAIAKLDPNKQKNQAA